MRCRLLISPDCFKLGNTSSKEARKAYHCLLHEGIYISSLSPLFQNYFYLNGMLSFVIRVIVLLSPANGTWAILSSKPYYNSSSSLSSSRKRISSSLLCPKLRRDFLASNIALLWNFWTREKSDRSGLTRSCRANES